MRMKKKKHGAERMKLLLDLICKDVGDFANNSEKIFGNKNPLRIEIGCGKGDFIREKSKADDEYNYLAIEKIADVCVVAVEKYAQSRNLGVLAPNGGWKKNDGEVIPLGSKAEFDRDELGNVRFCVGDAALMLDDIPDGTIDALFINFCDPWDKKGYEKRRLTHISFLEKYSRILAVNGKIFFKTDNRGLFDFSLEQFEKSPLKVIYKTYDLHSSEMNCTNIETEYERNFTQKGFKINMLIAENNK